VETKRSTDPYLPPKQKLNLNFFRGDNKELELHNECIGHFFVPPKKKKKKKQNKMAPLILLPLKEVPILSQSPFDHCPDNIIIPLWAGLSIKICTFGM
jgi:hypothetical protein